MWNKAEENTEALRSAFEAAAEQAAREAEHATAEALARADQEYKGTTSADAYYGTTFRGGPSLEDLYQYRAPNTTPINKKGWLILTPAIRESLN